LDDRWEMNNLADSPEYHSMVRESKTAITAWMKQQGDDGYLEGRGTEYSDTAFAETVKNPPSGNKLPFRVFADYS